MRTFMVALFVVAGCEIEPCDPNQTKVWNASCFPNMPPPGSGGSPSTGGSTGEAGDTNTAGASTGEAGQVNAAGSGG
jgi:hypothetical protein